MAARVIHFGIDDCHRLTVLQRAGYDISNCSDVIQFRAALESEAEADAILVSDGDGSVPENVISLARSPCSAPIILFPYSTRTYQAPDVDLVVPTLTPPHEWLLDLANLIVKSRAIRTTSKLLCNRAEQLRRETQALCEKSRKERARSRREAARNAGLIPRRERDPGPDSK